MAGTVEVVSNNQVILNDYVTGFPKESDMKIIIGSIKLKVPEGSKDTALLKNLHFSCDPCMRERMSKTDKPFFVNSFKPGSRLNGHGVSKEADSTHLKYKKGDLVWGFTGWEECSVITAPELIKIQRTDVPLSHYSGILGCYVVGSAGSKQKVDLLKNNFGFDDVFNYKGGPDLDAALKRFTLQSLFPTNASDDMQGTLRCSV